jgi:hypothetical protein
LNVCDQESCRERIDDLRANMLAQSIAIVRLQGGKLVPMVSRRWFLLGFAAAASFPAQAHAQRAWVTYKNDRFGTTIEYPSDLFRPAKSSPKNDFRRFVARNGAEFTCSGVRNALRETVAEIEMTAINTLDQGAMITHRERTEDSFVLWAAQAGRIFYQHSILSHNNEILNAFIISYPARQKIIYDPIVTRMADSFKAGAGTESGPL